ncbi:hypothetical protein DC74_1634 [Streptomyces noursei]|nr:hypothetical protein DC74_1634 [Streptomyces noursei]
MPAVKHGPDGDRPGRRIGGLVAFRRGGPVGRRRGAGYAASGGMMTSPATFSSASKATRAFMSPAS